MDEVIRFNRSLRAAGEGGGGGTHVDTDTRNTAAGDVLFSYLPSVINPPRQYPPEPWENTQKSCAASEKGSKSLETPVTSLLPGVFNAVTSAKT